MKHAYVFPGQGAQAVGMGKDLYDNVPAAKELFEKANEILGFRITDIMFAGTDEELKQTKVTQPAVFLHSVIMAKALGVKPDAVAGHSLGEFSALVVAGALSFEDGLKLVSKRAMAMQAACEAQPGTMAAILGLEDSAVEEICASVDGVVVAANYNCPGQLVISGAVEAVEAACEKAKAAGARRALRLPVGVPLAADGARQAGARKGHLRSAVPDARVPDLSERGRQTLHRSRRHQGQPDRPADSPRALDLHRQEHVGRRRDGIHRTRPRHRPARSHPQGGRKRRRRVEIDLIGEKTALKNQRTENQCVDFLYPVPE